MDIRCFIGTIFKVLRRDGVIEGKIVDKKNDRDS